ncbi:MAG: putative rane protein [Frankiales bacterium]|jgi:putative membrane protein|nr:putative rane protein [Frankiales bacterium]
MNLLAESCYRHDGWPFPFLFPLVFLLVFLVVLRPWRRRRWHGMGGEHVLAERYARGEIDEDEYRARRQVLRDR